MRRGEALEYATERLVANVEDHRRERDNATGANTTAHERSDASRRMAEAIERASAWATIVTALKPVNP